MKKLIVFIGNNRKEVLKYNKYMKESCIDINFYDIPENGLYPMEQLRETRKIVRRFLSSNYRVVVYTHSPYVLGQINNCLYAYRIGLINESDAEKIMNKDLWLPDIKTKAFKAMVDCEPKDIFDREIVLIDNAELDEASVELNTVYAELSNLYE